MLELDSAAVFEHSPILSLSSVFAQSVGEAPTKSARGGRLATEAAIVSSKAFGPIDGVGVGVGLGVFVLLFAFFFPAAPGEFSAEYIPT